MNFLRFPFVLLSILGGILPVGVQAHLLHPQEATLRLEGDKGYLAVAIPVTALVGVDDDGDGRLSPQEIGQYQDAITDQFTARFQVSSPEGAAPLGFAWITNPQDSVAANDRSAPTAYLIMMAGAQFASAPSQVTIQTDLFGKTRAEQKLTFRARRNDHVEKATLTKAAPTHDFFVSAP